MPLYEYECQACGHRFEVIQRFSDPAIDACQKCGAPVRKLLSSAAIQFKGSGWYVTDYARKDSGSSHTSSPAGESKSDASSAPSSDKSSSGSPGGSSAPSTPSSSSSS